MSTADTEVLAPMEEPAPARVPDFSPLVARRVFEHQLATLLDENRHATGCLLQVEIDRLKALTDRLGADAGHAVARVVCATIAAEMSSALITQGTGDSFLVLLRNTPLASATRHAQAICRAVRASGLAWQGEPLHLSVSGGIVELTIESANGADALCAVDTAATEARLAGGNCVRAHRWNDSVVVRTTREFNELPRLQRAIAEDRFTLFFQPIQALNGASLPAGELLIRMIGEDGAIRPPASFMPVAERYALTPAIDRFGLRTALNWLASHPRIVGRLNYLSLNLNGQTLCDAEVRGWLESQIYANSQFASRLCFEITETAMIRNLVPVRGFLERMAALGCRFALDDFGTGFSSLGYLQSLPVDFVKIDGAFVRGCDQDSRARTMLCAINNLCHTLGKRTVAEFAETPATLAVLRDIGIDYAQGYAISCPFRLEELARR